jgi:hypothetical protein
LVYAPETISGFFVCVFFEMDDRKKRVWDKNAKQLSNQVCCGFTKLVFEKPTKQLA